MRFIELLEGKIRATVYHGSNAKFDQFDAGKSRIPNDFYGGGIAYFTDNLEVGKKYAIGMSKKKGSPFVYEVSLSLKKMFDIDEKFTGKKLAEILPNDIENFARGAGLLSYGSDKYSVLAGLKNQSIELTGDQVWKGLSKGQVNTADAREWIKEKGYDGLRYNGGVNMGMDRHNVYLAYYPESIQIKKVVKL